MNTTDFEHSETTIKAQETANASSSTYQTTLTKTTNCQPKTDSAKASFGDTEDENSLKLQTQIGSISQETSKVFAPVITHDVSLPNSTLEVPMVMVPVQDSRTLMAIQLSKQCLVEDTQVSNSSCKMQEEQQARDLLVWNDGIGTLDGCDLHFKINQLGCLELLDSEDESENYQCNNNQSKSHRQNAISSSSHQSSSRNSKNSASNTSNNTNKSINGIKVEGTISADNANARSQKRAKVDNNNSEPAKTRQISPGSSLLRDGPNIRRPKTSSSGSATPLLKKIEHNNNYSALLEKLIPKQKLTEITLKNVDQWTLEDVRKFVDSIPGCTGYGDLFELQQICGKSLMYLDQRDLLDVINVRLGPAVKIYHAISLLKRSQ